MMMPKEFSLKILHVAPECAPLAKKGGLGDVVGALPKALQELDIDARVLIPAWPGVFDNAKKFCTQDKKFIGDISIALNWRAWTAHVWEVKLDRLHIYMLEQDELFSNPDIYPEKMTVESSFPFLFLSFASFELPSVTCWKPQFLHAHDWTAAPVPAALRWHRYYSSFNGDYDTVFTIHNLAHQGLFDPSALSAWGFDPKAFSPLDLNSMEFYGQVNLMKGAIITSEAVTTVSPRYSWDIQTPGGGFGLDGVIVAHKNKLCGIINGIDYDVWNPLTDKMLPCNYSRSDLSGKTKCREALLEKCGFKDDGRPVVIFIGRLTEQKGIDIMLDALEKFLPENIYAVIVGSGNELYNRKLSEFAEDYSESVHPVVRFSEEMAHLAYSGGDILLMPSLFEPCGLSQLIAFAYGTIPVARATGGLADTIIDADDSADGTGFLFTEYSIEELVKALDRALDAKRDTKRWNRIINNSMLRDFSWAASAKAYAELYRNILTSD
ncbi:MAG: glycogen synthase [Synergistaceae bacterium]|nr:glycogen synthase [Synergistaceae bacterium]